MKVLFDTSVLVAGVIESHPAHDRVFSWFCRVADRELELFVAAHSLAELGLTGGVVYDAIITAAAKKSNCDAILTLNRRDFVRVWPEGEELIIEP